jgi:anti-sigma B factor antagonist
MIFRVTEDDKAATVFLTGDIDLERSPAARAALLATLSRGRPLVVDLAGVSYMDSSGVASLVEAYQKARAASLDFSLARVGAQVLKVLTLARLDKVFPILSTV